MKKYIICQTRLDGTGCERIHGIYTNWFIAFFRFLKISVTETPIARTRYYIDTQEVENAS